jgi:exodeoxyribonuclease-5
MTEWSPQQADALAEVGAWLTDVARGNAEPVFKLFGYAGTGKSTLAKHIGQIEQDGGGYCQFAAFTGKAAVVLRRKGCTNARTLHSLIYSPHEKSKEALQELEDKYKLAVRNYGADHAEARAVQVEIDMEKERLQQPGFTLKQDALTLRDYDGMPTGDRISLFVIDECSMVDSKLGTDLLSYGVPVLVLGDPAQLPPVGGGGFFTEGRPNVLLTEIHRQAADNPIIALATNVRSGRGLDEGTYGESRVVPKGALSQDDWLAADQILVGRNNTRALINARVRQLRGYEGFLPLPGEKLVCLRNNREAGLLNGSLWECVESVDHETGTTFAMRVRSLDGDDRIIECEAHKAHFFGEKLDDWTDRMRANEFDFGYALTVHKSQGSQWDNVLLYDEWKMRDRQQWLYTGITRAAQKITVVQT